MERVGLTWPRVVGKNTRLWFMVSLRVLKMISIVHVQCSGPACGDRFLLYEHKSLCSHFGRGASRGT